jgi:multiple sugar transport system substrate-binding protein
VRSNRVRQVGTSGREQSALSRRRLLKAGGAAALLAGAAPSMIIPRRARAQQKTLRILQWKHFVPSYNEWFSEIYVKEWGAQNDTMVAVDFAGLGDINRDAKAEAEMGRGHDLVIFLKPTGAYEDQVIDHREIYEECEHRFGKIRDSALKNTYNPKTKKYFGFIPSYQPPVIIYRKDLWEAVQAVPASWADVLDGGRRTRLLYEKPVGFSLAPEDNSSWTMHAIMYSFGSSEQDEDGNPALKSKATLEVIKYVKALYDDAMTKDVLTWDAASNNRFMLDGEGALTLDTVSVPRASENMRLPIARDLWLSGAPGGPVGRLAPAFGLHVYFIWNFAENIDGAKQFLVDYIARSRDAFLASGFQNMPSFPDAVPDLTSLVAQDARASPPDKYRLLADVASWTTNVGYPGYSNPAISEIYNGGLIPTMFARAATGQLTPEETLDQADREVRRIFQNWKERGKV